MPEHKTRLEFISPNSKINRRFVCPAKEVNTGQCIEHEVVMHNARLAGEAFTLPVQGFQMLNHVTQVKDFYDSEQVDAIYTQEIKSLLLKLTGV